jgi:HEAT repeat protein
MESHLSTDNLCIGPTTDDPNAEVQAKLAKFILSLIQAFLRTGYYTPEHPQSKKARVGLFEEFQGLFVQKDELTFLVREDRTGRNILIEGILPETQHLNRIMMRGMAELYIPKFITFLERKDLISLTLKQSMTRTEFANFLDIMSEPTFVDTHDPSSRERFSQALKKRGILRISHIFNEDLLAAKAKIPWRARLALSRLKKDVRMAPLLTAEKGENMKKARGEVIQDVTRPIRSGEVIYYVLLNSELAETPELKRHETDREIALSLSDSLLMGTSRVLLKEVEHGASEEVSQGQLRRLARPIASTIAQRNIDGGEPVLEALFRHKLISFQMLPRDTQAKIKLERLANKFLRYSKSFFNRFDQIKDKEQYLRVARSFVKLIPELIRQDRYGEVLTIISHIDGHFNLKKHLSIYAGQVLEEMGKGRIPEALKEKFLTEKKETRLAIAPVFLSLHVGAVPYLLAILKESEDQWVRKQACEILVQIGSSAVTFILNELNKKEIGVEHIADIIRVLGDIRSEKSIGSLSSAVSPFLSHPEASLREEALGAYYKIKGSDGEEVYVGLLDDPDMNVKKRAIQCLGRMKSQAALGKFLDMLADFENLPSEITKSVEVRLFAVLGLYTGVDNSGSGPLEDYLLDTLNRRLTIGALGFFKKTKSPLSEEAVAAICESLGNLGTSKSLPMLEKLGRQHEKAWQGKAVDAIKQISERP